MENKKIWQKTSLITVGIFLTVLILILSWVFLSSDFFWILGFGLITILWICIFDKKGVISSKTASILLIFSGAFILFLAFSIGFWSNDDADKVSSFMSERLSQSTLVYMEYVFHLATTPLYFASAVLGVLFVSFFIACGIYLLSKELTNRSSGLNQWLSKNKPYVNVVLMTVALSLVAVLPMDAWPILSLVGYLAFRDFNRESQTNSKPKIEEERNQSEETPTTIQIEIHVEAQVHRSRPKKNRRK